MTIIISYHSVYAWDLCMCSPLECRNYTCIIVIFKIWADLVLVARPDQSRSVAGKRFLSD